MTKKGFSVRAQSSLTIREQANAKKRQNELWAAFDRWFIKKDTTESPTSFSSRPVAYSKPSLFEAFVAGADSDVPMNSSPSQPNYVG